MTTELGRERFADAGLNPPAIRDIPIWLGGKGPAAVRRAVAWGSGLILSADFEGPEAEAEFRDVQERLHAAADAAGRPREELGIEVWVSTDAGDPDAWRDGCEMEELGATHVSLQTYEREPVTPARHIERAGLIADAVIQPLGGDA